MNDLTYRDAPGINPGLCNSSSPDGEFACQKRINHTGECRNPKPNDDKCWCGYCMEWTCKEHGVGQPDKEQANGN